MNYKDFVASHKTAEQVPDKHFYERIRNWRNTELADKAAWATYRQALRDLPAQNADPKKIKFPTRPEA